MLRQDAALGPVDEYVAHTDQARSSVFRDLSEGGVLVSDRAE